MNSSLVGGSRRFVARQLLVRHRLPVSVVATRASDAFRASSSSSAEPAAAAVVGGAQQKQSSAGNVAAAAGALGLLGAGAAAYDYDRRRQSTAECCGIAAVAGGKQHDAREFLLEALSSCLKYRGYDGAGIATVSDVPGQTMAITKFANTESVDSMDLVREHSGSSSSHHLGIAHTRWATHGGKTDVNAHPHTDTSGTVAIVHNGTLFNANELRRDMQDMGHTFKSQTDTEVIAKLIGHYRDATAPGGEKLLTIKEATEKALNRCVGTWGLCVMCSDVPTELVVASNGSPMVIGVADDGRTFVASETSAFSKYTKNFISMKDGEIGVVHADGRMLDLTRTEKTAETEEIQKLSPEFDHWAMKEIMEQPEAIARALGFGGRMSADRVQLGGLDRNHETVSQIQYMTLASCGSSLNAAKYAEKLMKSLGSFRSVTCLDCTDGDVKDLPQVSNPKECGVIAVTQSGETKDLVEMVHTAIGEEMTVMSVVNSVGSSVARTTKLGAYCNAGRENAVSSTKTFACEVTVLALIGLWFRQARDKMKGVPNGRSSTEVENLREALMRLPITFGMAARTRPDCKKVAERLNGKEHCFVLGKGFSEPIAMEGALKIKEMSYMHAEGYSGGALKHGPFALIEDDNNGKFGSTPIILLIMDDQHAHHMRTCGEEVKARGAEIIIITDKPSLADGLDDNPIVIPSNGPMTALGAVLPLQMIAYELALLRGINPDKPRNLVKTYAY